MTASAPPLTVAVTGPTGTFGHGLLPLLQADDRVGRVVGIARRPFDPAEKGWTKLDYRQGDVRDPDALKEAFTGADVVVHLAFLIVGGPRGTTRAINVEGTVNAFRAAAAAGVTRFVYASSVAAYGFHDDNPIGMDEDWPTRPADKLFYAREKAEIEGLLDAEQAAAPEVEVYRLRPSIVVGPHAVGGKDVLPQALAPLATRLQGRFPRLPVRLPAAVPAVPIQLVHEDDVGSALLRCVLAEGPPGAYNIAGAGDLTLVDVAREIGLQPLPLPAGAAHVAARAVRRLPWLPGSTQWVEALAHPAVMDTSRAIDELGWRPRYTALEALQDTLKGEPAPV